MGDAPTVQRKEAMGGEVREEAMGRWKKWRKGVVDDDRVMLAWLLGRSRGRLRVHWKEGEHKRQERERELEVATYAVFGFT